MARRNNNYNIRTYSARSLKEGVYFPMNTSLVQCREGSAIVEINSHRMKLEKGMNFLLNSTSMVRVVSISCDANCLVIEFSSNYIWDYCPFITNQIFDIISSIKPDLYSEQDNYFGNLIFSQLEIIRQTKDYAFSNIVISNLLTNYLLNLYQWVSKRIDQESTTSSGHVESILIRFWHLCKECHTRHRKVEYYAKRLNISARYLHRLSKGHYGITPKQVIDHCVLRSAKRLLITTDKTSQEISIELSFPDQATFGQFFKRNIGLSPSQFRHQHYNIV